MSDDEIGCYEGRYEYWDADSELAWMVRDVSPRHEEPSSRLVGTGPEDDPFLGAERFAARRAGVLEERLSTLEGLLAARNIPVAGRLDTETDRIASMPRDALLKAALESTDWDDSLRRVRS